MTRFALLPLLTLVGCGAPPEDDDNSTPPFVGFIQAHLEWAEVATNLDLHLVDTARGGMLGDPLLDCWVGNGSPDWGVQGDDFDDPIVSEIFGSATRESLSYRMPLDGEYAIYIVSNTGSSDTVNLRIDFEPGDGNDAYLGSLIVLNGSFVHAADVRWPEKILTVPMPFPN